ncbi:recombinase RecT [Paenibacillus periandrae]|uniref:recombinase RecT n=1 Tax=Paenibacillus periandrae TaxID=1761741 RepID=UPI001F0976C2|nr:RecT family recombinase [Paenibacillus periandrae]
MSIAIVKKETVDVVSAKVRQFQERGEIHFPANYSPENAIKSAWLMLQNVQTKDFKPALEVCTRDSIANALLDMVVQGLNPAKKQGYFIVYGKLLTFQRSYFGTMAVTKQVTQAEDIDAQVIYDGDEFEFEIVKGRKKIITHKSSFSNIDDSKIIGAYCSIFWPDGREYTEIMTMAEIKKSWKKSKMSPDKEGSTHNEFPSEMAKRTVINRACKAYMNTSNDSSLIMKHFRQNDDANDEAEAEEEIAQNANGQIIDVTPNRPPEKARQGDMGQTLTNRDPKSFDDAIADFERDNPPASGDSEPDWA